MPQSPESRNESQISGFRSPSQTASQRIPIGVSNLSKLSPENTDHSRNYRAISKLNSSSSRRTIGLGSPSTNFKLITPKLKKRKIPNQNLNYKSFPKIKN